MASNATKLTLAGYRVRTAANATRVALMHLSEDEQMDKTAHHLATIDLRRIRAELQDVLTRLQAADPAHPGNWGTAPKP